MLATSASKMDTELADESNYAIIASSEAVPIMRSRVNFAGPAATGDPAVAGSVASSMKYVPLSSWGFFDKTLPPPSVQTPQQEGEAGLRRRSTHDLERVGTSSKYG
jgi:hypothetical protein